MQQRIMQQRMMQQQMMQQTPKEEKKEEEKKSSLIDKLKIDMKEPSIVALIVFILLLPQTSSIITSTKISFLTKADGSININGMLIKALIGGLLYFIVKKYL